MSSASIQADADAKLSAEPGPRGMYWTSGERVGDKATIQFGVHRSGPTRVTVEGDRLVLRIPIAIDNGRVDVTARGPLHRVRSYEFGGSGVVTSRPRRLSHCPAKFSANASARGDFSMRRTCCSRTAGFFSCP